MAAEAVYVKQGAPFSQFLGSEISVTKRGDQVCELFTCYKKLISLGIEAIEQVRKGFIPDPTVGENACQIRSAMYTDFVNADEFFDVIESTREAFERGLKQFSEVQLPGKKEPSSLTQVLNQHDAEVFVDERMFDLVAGHLLVLSREPERGVAKDLHGRVQPWEKVKESPNLKNHYGFSRNTSGKLEKWAKQHLADVSVQFLQNGAQQLSSAEEEERLYWIVSGDRVKTTDLGLRTAPCFSGAEIIFAHACSQKTPIVVRIHQMDAETVSKTAETTFFFRSDGEQYVPAAKGDLRGKRAAIMTEALSVAHPCLTRAELEEELYSRPVTETLLAFMATHPSYGGNLKNEVGPRAEDERTIAYAEKAMQWGCCPNNPRVCRPYHMYPISLEHVKGDDAPVNL